MLQILSVTGPIYLIMAAGYMAVRWGFFTREEARVLGRFVVNFCVPALVFRALSQRTLSEVLNGPYLAAYALGSLAVLLGAVAYAHRLRGKPMSLAALQGLGMSGSNSAFVGYPIILQLLGPPAGVALALTMMVENLLVMPLAFVLADSGGTLRWHRALALAMRGLLRNPMFLGILAGFTFALFDLHLPEVLDRTAQITATAASPLALFVIGASLVGLRLEGLRRDLAVVVLGKLVLHPVAVFLALLILPPLDPLLRVAAVIFAGMPMLSLYPALAQKYQQEGFCAAALLVATVLSFVTISVWIWAIYPLLELVD
jgi:malonate transporter